MKLKHKLILIILIFFNITNLYATEKFVYVDMEFLVNSSEAGKNITSKISKMHKKELEELKKIEEEKEIALKQKEEEEKRIVEENRRIKEWEEKFDREQKIKEDELIKKFYSDRSTIENDSQNIEDDIEKENIENNIEKENIENNIEKENKDS